MSDQPETLAAILAEMRLDADILVFPTLTPDKLRTYADRLKEAAGRERVEREYAHKKVEEALFDEIAIRDENIPQSAPGNAAALREALEQALAYCESDQKSGIAYSDNDVLVPMLRAALAAPARNADRFATAEEARRAFEEEHSREIVHNLYTATFDWLFATAEGKEADNG